MLAGGLFTGGITAEIIQRLVSDPVIHAASPWLPPLLVALRAAGDIGADLIASFIEKKGHARDAALHLLTNHDIALTQAAAIRRRLEDAAHRLDQTDQKAQRKRLLTLAVAANEGEQWWVKAVQDPFRHELESVRDHELVNLIATHVSGQKRAVLPASVWRELLTEADMIVAGGPVLDSNLVHVLADKLEEDLAADFFEAIKADLESSGKTYAAVSLRFFGEILLEVRKIGENQLELANQSRGTLQDLVPGLDATLTNLAHAAVLLQRLDQLPSDLRSQLKEVNNRIVGQLARIEGKLDTLTEEGIQREVCRRLKETRTQDKQSRVFFNNGWDGFETDTDKDVLFYLSLAAPRQLVHYIELSRQYRLEVYTASEQGLRVNPQAAAFPYEHEATLTVCFGSSKVHRQSETNYYQFFKRYDPPLPAGVQLYKGDGNAEAMWTWTMKIPTEWLQERSPFVTDHGKAAIRDVVDSWIFIHNAEIQRIAKSNAI
jgi:hypothetical protein